MTTRRTLLAVSAIALLCLVIVLAVRWSGSGAASADEELEELKTALTSSNQERDSLKAEVKQLNRRLADLEQREGARDRMLAAGTMPRAPEPARVAPAADAAVAAPPPPAAPPRITTVAPAGWSKNGSAPSAYAVGVDPFQMHAGAQSAYVKSTLPSVDGFGGMMQMTAADELVGKRVRFSAWVKTQDANSGGGHLWFRIDANDGSILGFDNMDGRALEGSTDWQQVSVVLDVPPGAAGLAYGFFVAGAGQMWVSEAKLEPVGLDVPSTDMRGSTPRNLDFK